MLLLKKMFPQQFISNKYFIEILYSKEFEYFMITN